MGVRSGHDFIEALRDGRRVWNAGRRIEDVPSHPGFEGVVSTLAGLYDLQHTADHAPIMTVDWGGERISYGYFPPRTIEELRAKRRNVEFWAERTFGVMGRLPEFCAELTVGMLDAADVFADADPRFGENARDYHRYCAVHDLCLTHALSDQFYDRSKRIRDQRDPDQILHIVGESSEGPIVRGLRNLATLAPVADEVLAYSIPPRQPDEEDYAIAFAVPMNVPGLTIICRDLYAEHADVERLPLSARFDEVDATLIFDDVVVPWERVFVYRRPDLLARYHGLVSMWSGYSTLVRLVAKLEATVGVADLLTEWSGGAKNRLMQMRIGELMADVEVLRACLTAAEVGAHPTRAGYLAPEMSPAYRIHSVEASDRSERLVQEILTSSLVLTGGASDLECPEVGPYIDRYFRNNAPTTRDHLRLLAIAADLVQSAFSGRNLLYERLQSGDPDGMRVRAYGLDRSAVRERLLRFIHDDW
ncbi:MAG TPA: 4-hydroxyphenylacetate 3-hydroxylase N-terminal domain-containing protein [Chloroflexota bacterium]|nr:4-hydroxyphenylacetate 3-hydroxylase N-terminal domain-containing protein [Chloroflexota bacterium]